MRLAILAPPFITVPPTASINTSTLSVEMWATFDQVRVQGLIDKTNHVTSWRVYMRSDGAVEFDAISDTWNLISTTVPEVGKAYHVVATYDHTARQMKLYINGVLEGTLGGMTGTGIGGTASSNLRISHLSTNLFDGTLDEVAYYNYALTQQQVTDHYNAGKK